MWDTKNKDNVYQFNDKRIQTNAQAYRKFI